MPKANLLFPANCMCLSTEIQNIFKSENIEVKCGSGQSEFEMDLIKMSSKYVNQTEMAQER
jgi:hypothetical protein